MARPRKTHCCRGHALDEAHVARQRGGVKRTCRKCRYIRHKRYYGIGEADGAAGPSHRMRGEGAPAASGLCE